MNLPQYNKNAIRIIAEANSHSSDGIEKVVRLYDLLNAVNEIPELRSHLALKGGTAINLFIQKHLPRISEDVDMDVFGSDIIEKKDYLEYWKSILYPKLSNVFEKMGYKPQEQEKQRYGLFTFYLPYTTLTGGGASIKFEINYLSRVHVLEPEIVSGHSNIVGRDYSVTLLAKNELFAEKICALVERLKARDIFDASSISKILTSNDYKEIAPVFAFHAALHGLSEHCLTHASIELQHVPFSEFRQGLMSMLRRGMGFLDMVPYKEGAKLLLTSLNEHIRENERTFMRNYQNGTYEPQILFPQKADELMRHPKALYDMARSRNSSHDENLVKDKGIK